MIGFLLINITIDYAIIYIIIGQLGFRHSKDITVGLQRKAHMTQATA